MNKNIVSTNNSHCPFWVNQMVTLDHFLRILFLLKPWVKKDRCAAAFDLEQVRPLQMNRLYSKWYIDTHYNIFCEVSYRLSRILNLIWVEVSTPWVLCISPHKLLRELSMSCLLRLMMTLFMWRSSNLFHIRAKDLRLCKLRLMWITKHRLFRFNVWCHVASADWDECLKCMINRSS